MGVWRKAGTDVYSYLTDMVMGSNLRRTATASGVFIAQQATGATAFAYL